MKKVITVVVILITLVSCAKEDDIAIIDPDIFEQSFIYDIENNLINIDGEWIESYDFENNKAANDIMSVYRMPNGYLIAISLTYEFLDVQIQGIDHNQINDIDNVVMESEEYDEYLQNNTLFYIDVTFKQRTLK